MRKTIGKSIRKSMRKSSESPCENPCINDTLPVFVIRDFLHVAFSSMYLRATSCSPANVPAAGEPRSRFDTRS
jgi:hypothetical protein